MHENARSVQRSGKVTATPRRVLPLLPSRYVAAGVSNNTPQHRPRRLCISVSAEHPGTRVKRYPSPDRVAWSTRNAGQPKKLKAKRSLGQNFLQREEILVSIVEAAGVSPGDRVLEIGPGTGALTKHLLHAGASLIAVEKDDALHARLQHDFAQVRIHHCSKRLCFCE